MSSLTTTIVEYSNQRHNASGWTKYLSPLRYRAFFTIFTSIVVLTTAVVLLSISLPIRRCHNCIEYGNDEIQDDVHSKHTNDDDTREVYIKYKVPYIVGVVLLVLGLGVVVLGITFTLLVLPFLCSFDCMFVTDDDLEANNGAVGVCCSEGWAYSALPRRDGSTHKFVIHRDEWGWRGNCISAELSAMILYSRLVLVAMVHGILQFTYYYNQPFQRAKFIDKSKVGSYSYNVGAFIGSCMYSLYQVLLLPYLIALDLVHTPNSDLLIATNNFTSYLSIRRPLGTAIMLVRVLILGHLPCLRNTIYHIDSETSYITSSSGKSRNKSSSDGESALYTAIKLDLNLVIVFLVYYGANTASKYRKHLLRLLRNRNTSMAQLLIKKYVTSSELVNKRDKDGNTLLTAACTEQLHHVAMQLVLLGGDVYSKNNQEMCPLDYLTDRDAAARLEGSTALSVACMHGKVDRVKSIVSSSRDDTLRNLLTQCVGDNARTCIHLVIERGYNDILALFLEHFVTDKTLLEIPDSKGFTPVLLACSASNAFAIRQLIPKKVSLLVRNKNSNSCLHYTVKNNLVEGTRLLLRELAAQGMSSIDHLVNKKLQSPLHLACLGGNKEVLQLLLEWKPSCNTQDSLGNTPLYYCKDPEVLGLVLAALGADYSVRNQAGQSLAGYYCCNNSIALLQVLAAHNPSVLVELQKEVDQAGKAVVEYLDEDNKLRLAALISTAASRPAPTAIPTVSPSINTLNPQVQVSHPEQIPAVSPPLDVLDQQVPESQLFKYKESSKIVPI